MWLQPPPLKPKPIPIDDEYALLLLFIIILIYGIYKLKNNTNDKT